MVIAVHAQALPQATARRQFLGTANGPAYAALHEVTPTATPILTINTPLPGQSVTQSFQFAGWAIDGAAPTGTGVSAARETERVVATSSDVKAL